MHGGLVRSEYSFDVVQSISDQEVKGSKAGKSRHSWVHRTKGEEGDNKKNEQEIILYLQGSVQKGPERKFIRTEMEGQLFLYPSL